MGFIISTMLTYAGYKHLTPFGEIENLYLLTFLNGLASAGGVWLIHTLQEALERSNQN
jgi:hypothetical protein